VVRTLDKSKHGLEDGMLVQFKEVKGMTELNDSGRVFEVKTINPYEFSIGDTTAFGDYVSGGIATEVKKVVEMSFVRAACLLLSIIYSYSCWCCIYIYYELFCSSLWQRPSRSPTS
jgi:hypothetical protein